MTREAGKNIRDHYASLSRRMWASTIDSTLVFILIAPIFDMVLEKISKSPDAIMTEFQKRAAANPQLTQDVTLMWKTMYETGLFNNWLLNTGAQLVVLSLATAVCWKLWSSTPGKMLLRMKIVDSETEAPINNKQIVLRLIGYGLSTAVFLLGFFWISLNRRRQGWHDMLAGTVVIVVPKNAKLDSAIAHLSGSREP